MKTCELNQKMDLVLQRVITIENNLFGHFSEISQKCEQIQTKCSKTLKDEECSVINHWYDLMGMNSAKSVDFTLI